MLLVEHFQNTISRREEHLSIRFPLASMWPVCDFSSRCFVIIFMLISLFVNLVSPFLLNSIDLDQLKGLVAASALIEAKSNHKVDVEHCKLYGFYCMKCITFHSMIFV